MQRGDPTRQAGTSDEPAPFPLTTWGTVVAARALPHRRDHLERLFRLYWGPVHHFIRRSWNRNAEDARDLTQEFFVRLLETDFLRDVGPGKGRFRAYVKACLRNFLLDVRKTEGALKRGGHAVTLSLNATVHPPEIPAPTPDESFDLEWAAAALSAAVDSLRETLAAAGRDQAFRLFHRVDVEPPADGRPSYARIAEETGLSSQEVKSEIDYARKTFRRLLRVLVRDTTIDDSESEAEYRFLFPR